MVDFLNDDVAFSGDVTTNGELIAVGGLTISDGGLGFGEPASSPTNTWRADMRVQVADTAERDAVVAWRATNDPITATRPLHVWRADGSSTGVSEITVDGVNWFAESPLAGDIEMTLATAAPYGWALMQGQLLADAATNYPALWATAAPALRVGASLKIPDMRGRVPIGAGTGTGLTIRNLGDLLGTESVVLVESMMPKHKHDGKTAINDRSLQHTHVMQFDHEVGAAIDGTGRSYEVQNNNGLEHRSHGVDAAIPTAGPNLNHQHDFGTELTGGDAPHPNMQPSAVVNFKVKL